jgi:hypothetical protein
MATLDKRVTRGAESWTFIWVTLAVLLGWEAAVSSLFECLVGRVIVIMAVMPFTAWQMLTNGRLQNHLIGWKARVEGAARKVD